MGTVFEALHEGLGSLVAIKVLHPNQLQKRDAVQRFHHEARAAARIGHPNICEVHDAGTLTDGRPFLVMERLSGVTLADWIRAQGGLPFQEVLDTVTQVLSGLHAAHEKGILHRDVKPENVFLSERVGCPPLAKLLDFGVSKVMAEHAGAGGFSEVEVTRTGVVLGTPYYLAPEQARGERNLDPRVDLYACGILLYEALTARRPFRAANYNALLINILTTKPRPARELRPDLPAGFSRVLDKSIERDPAARFQTALEFQAAIQPFSPSPQAMRAPWRAPEQPSTGSPLASGARRHGRTPLAPRASAAPAAPASEENLEDLLESVSSEVLTAKAPAPASAPPRPSGRARSGAAQEAPRPVPRPSTSAGSAPRVPRPDAAVPAAKAPSVTSSRPPESSAEVRTSSSSKKTSQGFDDQATEVDLPRTFAPSPKRSAPLLGPPLRPPQKSSFEDESATEIMPRAVRAELPGPPKTNRDLA